LRQTPGKQSLFVVHPFTPLGSEGFWYVRLHQAVTGPGSHVSGGAVIVLSPQNAPEIVSIEQSFLQ
jgi:hypothetical protein